MKKNLAFFCVLLSFQAMSQADTTRYVVVTSESIIGKQLIWSDGPGRYSYIYEYNDRGRGPKLRVDIVAEDGHQITSRKASGVDYLKGPVNETFEIANGVARWTNKIENDQRNVTGPVLYSAMNGVPGEVEFDLKLLKKHAHVDVLDVLPSGNLKTAHVKSHRAVLKGFPIELELHSFSGIGGAPSYAWFTPKREYFATITPLTATIRLGFEYLIPELTKLQDQVRSEYFVKQAFTFTQKATTPIAIVDVSVFDSKKGKVIPHQTVIIEGGKIKEVGKSKNVKTPANAKTIPGNGKMLLPGLWDNHTHYRRDDGVYHLAAGVTNVKDMGNIPELPEMKKKIDNDELLGPEISVWSGQIDFAGPYATTTGGKIVSTLDGGKAAVNNYADRGYQQIKLYSSIPADWVQPLAAEAHKRGLKLVGHVPSHMKAERAINDGYDQVIHMNMLMLNFMSDTIDTRALGRFSKVAEQAKNINMSGPEVKKFIQLLKARKTVIDPTIAFFENIYVNEPGKVDVGYAADLNMFPPDFRRGLYTGGLATMKGHEADYKKSFDSMLKMVGMLHTNGITFLPGTDAFAGFTLHRELELYSKAGVPNAKVLQKATLTSAEVAGRQAELGSIEVGKKANLILVDGDPVKNISDIRRVELTIKNGNIYDPKDMYKSYGFGFWK
jgi:hypothetical protein